MVFIKVKNKKSFCQKGLVKIMVNKDTCFLGDTYRYYYQMLSGCCAQKAVML